MRIPELIEKAMEARTHSYSPYSGFMVGAALLTRDGNIYQGANIENASFGVTNCAERSAIFAAASNGEREYQAIAVVGGRHDQQEPDQYCPPCGLCRQVLTEFCDQDFTVILAKSKEDYQTYTLGELFPHGFDQDNL